MKGTKKLSLTDVWRIPTLGGCADGHLTFEQRNEILADPQRRLMEWWPPSDAWQMLATLHQFLEQRVKIWFSPILTAEKVIHFNPIEATCIAIYTETVDGYPQPFFVLSNMCEVETQNRSGSSHILIRSDVMPDRMLARVAEIDWIESQD